MKRRGLAIRVAVVAVVSAVGLGVVASPALAMDDYYCDNWYDAMGRMEQMRNEGYLIRTTNGATFTAR